MVEHYRSKLIDVALQRADIFRGGFGATNKFPMSPQLSALLEAYVQEPQPALADFLKLTLNQMINQGLRDHVGGGFFRYTTDPDWHTPHFEKMLYDNAQLARLYLRAADVLEMPDYREQAYAILDFILTDLREEKVRGLMTSTSAIDEKSVEGGVYLWDKHELQTHLSSNEYALVEKIWGLNTPQEFEAGYLPIQKVMPTMEERAALVLIIGKLKAIRSSRSLPKDQKRLASLNGLALIALSEAAQHETRYLAAATEIKHFLVNEMWHGNALYKARSKEKYLGTGELEDYAYAAAGMLSYARLTGAKVDMDAARQMTQQGWHRFHINAAWKLQQSTLLGNQSVEAVVADSSSPSPASVLIAVSWQMPDKALRTQALAALNAGHAELEHDIFWYATQVAAMMALQPMTQKKPQ